MHEILVELTENEEARLSLVPRPSEGGGESKAWYPLHAHVLLLFRFRLRMDTAQYTCPLTLMHYAERT